MRTKSEFNNPVIVAQTYIYDKDWFIEFISNSEDSTYSAFLQERESRLKHYILTVPKKSSPNFETFKKTIVEHIDEYIAACREEHENTLEESL